MDINKIKKVLIIRLSALGDVAMSIPIVYSVCRAYPQIEFTMLTSPHASNLFIEKPANLVIISAQIRGKHSGIKGLYTLYRELSQLFQYHSRFTRCVTIQNLALLICTFWM